MGRLTSTTHSEMDMPGYDTRKEADINDTKVNKAAYRRASMAARQFAKRKGISPIKATKALSEATRNQVDYNYGMGKQGQADVTRGLTGLEKRLSKGDRSGRFSNGGNTFTSKGVMTENFGKYLANETVNARPNYPVLRPKTPKGTMVFGKLGKLF